MHVAVVGGGLMGTASFGNVRRQGHDFRQMALAHHSLVLWNQLDALLACDVEFRAYGHMRAVFHEEGLQDMQKLDPGHARVNPDNTLRQLEVLANLIPQLRHTTVIRTWSGCEGYVADMLPVMGPSSKHEGLFHAFGFWGHGFQLGPGVGAVLTPDCHRHEI